MFKKIYKFLLYFSAVAVVILSFGLSVKLFSSSCCWCDEAFLYIVDGNFSFKSLFLPLVNNNWFSTPLARFFCLYLPKFFNLHPSDFKIQYYSIIESLILICFFTLWTSILYNKKNKILNAEKFGFIHVCVFLFSFLFYFMQVSKRTMIIFLYEGMFRMIMPVFLSIFFLKQLIDKRESNLPYTKFEYFSIFSTLFLCLISNEMVCFSLIVFLFLYFGSLLFEGKLNNDKFLNIGFIVISILSIFIFKDAFFRKNPDVVLNLDYFLNLSYLFSDFWAVFSQKVIIEHLVFYVIIFFGIILLLISGYKNKINIEIIKIILFYCLGSFSFFFALFLLGKTYYSGGYWIEHVELHVMFNFILYAAILFLLKTLLSKFPFMKYFVSVTFLTLFFCFINQYFTFYKNTYNEMNYVKSESYKIEKILRRASLNGEIGYLDSKYLPDDRFFFFRNEHYFEENLLLFDSLFITYMNSFENQNNFQKGFIFASRDLYSSELDKNISIFSPSELENPKFTKLLDKEFVLRDL